MRPPVRPRTSVIAAWIDGWRRVGRAPVLVLGVVVAIAFAPEWHSTLLLAPGRVPGALVGHYFSWLFDAEPFSFRGGAILLAGSYLVRPDGRLTIVASAESVLWMFLAGGLVDRLARARPVGIHHFFGTCGVFFFRFLRLGAVLGGATWMVLWLVGSGDAAMAASTYAVLEPIAIAVPLALIAMCGDMAQVRAVVEDRRSALGALGAAWRFIWRRPARVLALYLLNLIPFAIVSFLTPGLALWTYRAWGVGPTIYLWSSLALGVLFRLGCMATTVTFFQGNLAHAGYTASREPSWPDSPAVEAIANMEARSRAGTAGPDFPL